MKFTRVGIENFGRIQSASLALADRGLVLVQGENADVSSATSNGAGKSTLFEALSWALYGATAKGVSGDGVVRQGAKGGCAVMVEIQDEEVFWRVTRHRKHPKGKNALVVERDGENVSLGNDKLTQGLVDRVVGCSYDVFVAAVYAGQDAMPDLPAMTDRHLKLLIEEAAGVRVLEAAYENAREKRAAAEKTALRVQAALDEQDATLRLVDQRIKDCLEAKDLWAAQQVADAERSALRVAAMANAFRSAFGAVKALGDPASVDARAAVLDAMLAGSAAEKAKLADLEAVAERAGRAAVYANHARESASTEVKIAQAACKVPSEKCSECGAKRSAEKHAAHIDKLQERLIKAVDGSVAAQAALESAVSAAESAAESRDAFKAAMTDQSEVAAERGSLRAWRATFDAKRREAQQAGETLKRETAERDRRAADVNPYFAKRELLGRERGDAKARAASCKDELAEAELKKERAAAVASVFAPSGVRAHILDTVTPYLNARTGHYLSALTDGFISAAWTTLTATAKGELREKFTIEVSDADGVSGFASISGGEKRKVRLACALALQDLVATRADKPIPLFIADEIDAALDEAGLERLMGVLEEKARERGSVFVISHNSLTEWIDNVITVKRSGGVSSVI